MAILDCESLDSTLHSLAMIYALDVTQVRQFLNQIDLDKDYEAEGIVCPVDSYLRMLFESRFSPPRKQITSVCWFHLTRVHPTVDFAEGILHLGEALDGIWETLAKLLPTPRQRSNLKLLRGCIRDFQYNLKAYDSVHHGPYAMLVREAAFNAAEVCNHDYLEVPEIIEDICNGYQDRFGESVIEAVTAGLTKRIVKFISTKDTYEELLEPALLYSWCRVNAQPFSPFANTCFDSKGTRIPKSAILSVTDP